MYIRPQTAMRLMGVIVACLVATSCTQSTPSPSANNATPQTSDTPSPQPTHIPRPKATPTPRPTPFTAPGWFAETSLYWSGYSVPQYGITGIRAKWRQPSITGQPNSDVYIWIGVGGWDTTNSELVQIGTLAYISTDGQSRNNVAWYETLPQDNHLTPLQIAPGDQVSAIMLLAPGSTEKWSLSLTDLTTRRTFAINVVYPSSQIYADFIVEDPRTSAAPEASLYPFPKFSAETFTGADVRYGQQWYPLAALRSMQVTLVQAGRTLAVPGDIHTPDSFTVAYTGP